MYTTFHKRCGNDFMTSGIVYAAAAMGSGDDIQTVQRNQGHATAKSRRGNGFWVDALILPGTDAEKKAKNGKICLP